ncbi:hypothetical protein FEM48_Zijuj01G0014800 [Ziziphus jujuba var. spinosa]|uniref:Uncharacterized protein n=1 Tax=Ziziphus jujuba var. spinosa TaxID=714518 RepID=A0A978VYC3_ZIZJJ|nr:hypothetical protein FEM48_Zijuj01G0014800 [Ziziphus jujuba var. spinosa]
MEARNCVLPILAFSNGEEYETSGLIGELLCKSGRVIARYIRANPIAGGTTEFSSSEFNSSALSGFAAIKWCCKGRFFGSLSKTNASCQTETSTIYSNGLLSVSASLRNHLPQFVRCAPVLPPFPSRCITTVGNSVESASKDTSASISDVPPRIKFKRLDKTARHIMQASIHLLDILDKEAVGEVKAHREIPDIKPGYIVQLKVEVPDNKRRVSILKGIVIARRNAGLNTTFRIRRLVAGVGVESLFPLYHLPLINSTIDVENALSPSHNDHKGWAIHDRYSPNIKEIKVLDKKKVRRAKLYYLRDKMNALKKH